MKVTIQTLGEGTYTIEEIDQDTVMEMVEALGDEEQNILGFEMDAAMVYLLKRNIVAIEVD